MRIAITNWSRRQAGGVESYLASIIPELLRCGHSVGYLYEVDLPSDRPLVFDPISIPSWCVAKLGQDEALNELREWKPDVIYGNGLQDVTVEEGTLKIAPGIVFVHDYRGTCISGAKAFQFPASKCCNREFGWKCFLHYFPHRCGGLNPITMVKLFHLQRRRLEKLRHYQAVATHTKHMREEYLRHGLPPEAVFQFAYCINTASAPQSRRAGFRSSHHIQILFLGRMHSLKGGHLFLKSLPIVQASLDLPVHAVLCGDGPHRIVWERLAADVQTHHSSLHITFPGWLAGKRKEKIFAETDLIVLPSLWPEPLGKVGIEAGLYGIPAVGFAVGGIPEWLTNGVNGFLAPAESLTAESLASAILKCVCDPQIYAQLQEGALQLAQSYQVATHVERLTQLFRQIAKSEN